MARAKIIDIKQIQGDLVHLVYDTGTITPANLHSLKKTALQWLQKNRPELYRKATGETEQEPESIPKKEEIPEQAEDPKLAALRELSDIYHRIQQETYSKEAAINRMGLYASRIGKYAAILSNEEKPKGKPGRKNKLTAEVQEQIRAEHTSGATVRALATKYGVGVATIQRILEKGE